MSAEDPRADGPDDGRATLGRRGLLRAGVGAVLGAAAGPALAACDPQPTDRDVWRQSFTTPGSLDVTVVEAGGWCWFGESRTVITPSGRLYLGTVVGGGGTGATAAGSIEITSLDVSSGLRADTPRRMVTVERAPRAVVGQLTVDDHNNPGLEVTATGGVVALFSGHGKETLLHRAIDREGDGTFDLLEPLDRPDSIVPPGRGVSYGTVHRLDSGVLMAAYRGERYAWNLMRSRDGGESWQVLGPMLLPPSPGERPYVKLAADGERLWLACTEGHPNSYTATSIRVATVDVDGVIRTPQGAVLGAAGAGVPALSLPYAYRCPANADAWISDVRMVGGRPALSVSLRGAQVSNAAGEWAHDHLRVRPDLSGTWQHELVAHGGGELGRYAPEPNYSGLAAIDPTQHNRMVVATNVHPLTDVPLRSRADGKVHFELWEMNRRLDGAGWDATWLTRDSTADNIRPHVAVAGRTKILSWMQGRYGNALTFSTRIVSRQAG